jgi:predicted RND superfamily exporter protein
LPWPSGRSATSTRRPPSSGSIIIGNGINYAIILMSRYEEHRARGNDPEEALRCALGGTWRGTLVASIAASAAYASLTVTSFRGFYQFGVMGAAGALFCWLSTIRFFRRC